MGKGGGTSSIPRVEPVKPAETAVAEAHMESERAQRMRRGIASTFSRPTMGVATAGATSGAAKTLGGE